MIKGGYFAASNSGEGFKNYYSDVFVNSDRIFVIKGGPGTGKGRFMSEVADYAVSRGWECERYYCSSDPNSLDGIRLMRQDKVISVIDGTPPHAWEPKFPGVRDEIVNLGDFWNGEHLREHSDEIKALEARKKELWRAAYRWLSGSLDMCRNIKDISVKFVDGEALQSCASELLENIPCGGGFEMRIGLISSVGMYGERSLDEYLGRADKIFIVKDYFMTAHLLFSELLALARKKALSVRVSYDPVDAERIDGLYFEESGLCVVVTDINLARDYETIHMSEICNLDKASLRDAEYAERARCAMLAGACDTLESIKDIHFRLEKIYSSAMDFSAKEKFTRDFCEKIFGL